MRLTAVTMSALALAFISSTVAAAPDEISIAAVATELADRGATQTPTAELPQPPAPQTAQYRVTVFSDWTSASHPTTRPPNSHFSPTVVVNHAAVGGVFAPGTIASPGIERMAETGSTSTLQAELSSDDLIRDVQVGSSIFGAGTNTFTMTAKQFDELISLVAMLAPSPDWFVGVRDVDLFVDGAWVERLDLDLANYDAGTDSGANFRSPNQDTNPPSVISGPSDSAFLAAATEGRFGHVVIERI